MSKFIFEPLLCKGKTLALLRHSGKTPSLEERLNIYRKGSRRTGRLDFKISARVQSAKSPSRPDNFQSFNSATKRLSSTIPRGCRKKLCSFSAISETIVETLSLRGKVKLTNLEFRALTKSSSSLSKVFPSSKTILLRLFSLPHKAFKSRKNFRELLNFSRRRPHSFASWMLYLVYSPQHVMFEALFISRCSDYLEKAGKLCLLSYAVFYCICYPGISGSFPLLVIGISIYN